MPTARLADRALVSVTGPDAEHFLQNIVTVDLDGLAPGEAKPGALLSPQGKILFDFLVSRDPGDGFVLESRAPVADDFVRRLLLYRLRAEVRISILDQRAVTVSWDDGSASSSRAFGKDASESGPDRLLDRRFPDARVFRFHGAGGPAASAEEEAWHAFRVAHGVAESGEDYALNEAFPHDVLLDQFEGVGFQKGCYVGQEVVSRMQHRGTARRRVMIVDGASDLPGTGTEIVAGGRLLGTLGSVSGRLGLAIVRIDRVKDAADAGTEITAAGIPVRLSIPPAATFTFPAGSGVGDEA